MSYEFLTLAFGVGLLVGALWAGGSDDASTPAGLGMALTLLSVGAIISWLSRMA